MSATAFSLKNIVLGILLGMTAVAGWAFYPQIRSAVEARAPERTAESAQPSPTETDIPQDVQLPAGPSQPAAVEKAAPETVAKGIAKAPPADPAKTSDDPLEASPGWNPDVARTLTEPAQPLQAAVDDGKPPAADAVMDEETAPPAAEAQTVAAETPAPATKGPLPPDQQQEEALWRALLASPLYPDRAAAYPFAACFSKAASKNGLPLAALLGVAAHYSNFNPEVISDSGHGLLNVGWPRPAKSLGIGSRETLTEDPCANIDTGAAYLASLMKGSRGQWVPALAAYRRHVDPAYLGRIRDEDLEYAKELRRHVEAVIREPYQPKTMYAFWEFDEGITAKRFMKMVQRQSGVQLWMRQKGFSYVIYIPAADPQEKDRKLRVIEQETGLQAILNQWEDAPS